MAATLSPEDLKLEHIIKIESVPVNDEEWQLDSPRGFCQDTVWGQEELKTHGRTTYLVRSALALGLHESLMCHRAQKMSYHWYSRVWTLES